MYISFMNDFFESEDMNQRTTIVFFVSHGKLITGNFDETVQH